MSLYNCLKKYNTLKLLARKLGYQSLLAQSWHWDKNSPPWWCQDGSGCPWPLAPTNYQDQNRRVQRNESNHPTNASCSYLSRIQPCRRYNRTLATFHIWQQQISYALHYQSKGLTLRVWRGLSPQKQKQILNETKKWWVHQPQGYD